MEKNTRYTPLKVIKNSEDRNSERNRSRYVEGLYVIKERSDRSRSIEKYYRAFCSYAKARALILNFPWATFIALMIASNGLPDPVAAILTVSSSYFILLAVYAYNDVVDLEVDRVNATNRPLVSGRVSKEEIMRLTWFLNGSALAMTLIVNISTFVIASLLVLIGILYSHPKTHFKDTFPLKTFVTALGGLLASLMGGSAMNNISFNVIYAAVVFFAFVSVMAMLGDIGDIKGDRAAKRRTFPIVLGLRQTITIMRLIVLAIAASALATAGISGMSNFGIMMLNSVCGVGLLLLLKLGSCYEDIKSVKKMRVHMRFVHLFMQLSIFLGVIV